MGSVWDKANDNAHLKWDLCEAQAVAMPTSGGIRVEVWEKEKGSKIWSLFCGQGQIRTAEAVRQQIYSLPVLTTYLPTRAYLAMQR